MFHHKYRWFIAVLLFLAGMLNYLDRSALAVMAPLIKKELTFDDAQMGLLFSGFFVGYCVFCFIGGWCADRYGPRKTYVLAAGVWSLFCGATALVTSFSQLLVVRVMFGIGEGPMGTTTNKSISNWFPKKEIGRAVGFVNAGQPLGAALAAPIVGFVGLYLGWRIAFIVIALLGFAWVIACLFGYMVPQACWSLLQYVVPSARIGSTGGFVHLLANLAGILSPSITGFLIQYGGGYQSAFILSSLIAIFGTIVLLFLISQRKVDLLLNN